MKKRILTGCAFSLILFLLSNDLIAREVVGLPERRLTNEQQQRLMAGCEPANAARNLDINNVRTRIMNGGDMWWDLVGAPRYEVPKVIDDGVRRHSMFAGSLWIGGFDPGGNLRMAAMTYRQRGNDFWPGPLDTTTARTNSEECENWDEIWEVRRDVIDAFIEQDVITVIPESIRDWPAHGNTALGQSKYLAPFVDVSQTGIYEPELGDYPDVVGDQALWFIYNDRGNIHTETGAGAIGLEVQTLAFAFATNNELNNTTFYKYTVTNHSRDRLDSTFFGKWADPDIGYAHDDYVACDVDRSMGIAYNGNDYDPGVTGYGNNPPSIGTIFFQGPIGDDGNEIGMSKFIYYNNTDADNGNPSQAIHFYNYLNAYWKNGNPMCFGGDGFASCWDASQQADYMYPDDPRLPRGNNENWSENTAGNPVGDRRHLQSAGPFTLQPGAVNNVTVGIVWAKANSGGALGSLDLLRIAADRAQELYDNDFELMDGPDAPDLEVVELNREIILNMRNYLSTESYQDTLYGAFGNDTLVYTFQGYKLYQLKNAAVTAEQLGNPDLASLIYQGDIKDELKDLINMIPDEDLGKRVEKLMVSGINTGVRHSFRVNTDAFASEDDRLINFKNYYFMIVAYAAPDSITFNYDQYLEGRRNVRVYRATPHNPAPRFNGLQVNSNYGDGFEIKRLEGLGNMGIAMDFTNETVENIISSRYVERPVYKSGSGPFEIKVINPLKVPDADFELRIIDNVNLSSGIVDSSARWILTNLTTNEMVHSDTTLGGDDEKIIHDWGISIKLVQLNAPGYNPGDFIDNGFIEATMRFDRSTEPWLTGVSNFPFIIQNVFPSPFYWIRSGDDDDWSAKIGDNFLDPNNAYATLLDGRIAPYAISSGGGTLDNGRLTHGPRASSAQISYNITPLSNLRSVDIVLTSDKDKWTRTIVVETGDDPGLSQGKAEKFTLRPHPSLNKDGSYSKTDSSYGWFPGYAIDIETGERLNIIYGESSFLKAYNGADMIWNPTSDLTKDASDGAFNYSRYLFGGKHYFYIMRSTSEHLDPNMKASATRYDEGKTYHSILKNSATPLNTRLQRVFHTAMWTMMPVLEEGYSLESFENGLIPNDVKIRLRVNQPYRTYNTPSTSPLNDNYPVYSFSSSDLAAVKEVSEVVEKQVERVNIVPNPYYASSPYELSQLDNRVKFVNLPKKVDIFIYTENGTLIRKLSKNESDENHRTFMDWDMRNTSGVPVSSGIYIIHIDAHEHGQKNLKWFAITRPIDLDTF